MTSTPWRTARLTDSEARAGAATRRPITCVASTATAISPSVITAAAAGGEELASGVHGKQRVILRRQLTQCRAARHVDERQMRMALDHAGHQELALGIDPFGAVRCKRFRLRHDGRDALAIDQDLARER